MKPLYWAAVGYTALGLPSGLFYRELTKAHQFTGSQVETTSYHANSGASSCAALRAKCRFPRAALLNGSSQSACSQAKIAAPGRRRSHSASPRFWSAPEEGSRAADWRKALAAAV